MSIIELTKVFSHLQSKCEVRGLHNSFLVTDGKELEIKIWRNWKEECRTVMSKTVSLKNQEAVRGMLLSINEALSEEKTENVFN